VNPRIAVLTIGNELLNGDITDSNTQRMAEILAPQGFVLYQRLSVNDDLEAIREALLFLGQKNHFVIVSGGLGPTRDDRTAEAAALALQRPLVKNEKALEVVRRFFRKLGREMTTHQEKQSMVPEGATILENDRGSAPGFMLQHENCRFAFLPGVPEEMAMMTQNSVLPLLYKLYPEVIPWRQKTFKLLGLPESTAESMLEALNLPEIFQVAFCVNLPFVHVKLSLQEKEGDSLLNQVSSDVRSVYGEHLVAEDDETLAENVAGLLIHSGKTLSLAESCTGGWIAKMLTDIPGSSAFLERGAVSYSNEAKSDWLKVPEEVFSGSGAVSEECALAMARGILRTAVTDLAVSVTGIAGPEGGTPQKPVGTVFIALVDGEEEKVEHFLFPGDRDRIRLRSACSALNLLRCHLLKHL
jgi:competence/damage-inducible protein CinA-like protein